MIVYVITEESGVIHAIFSDIEAANKALDDPRFNTDGYGPYMVEVEVDCYSEYLK